MCIPTKDETSEAARLRRVAGVVAASAGSLAVAPALSLTHGHPVFGWTIIAAQICLLATSVGLLARAQRQR